MKRRDLFKSLAAIATVATVGATANALNIDSPKKNKVILAPGAYELKKPLIINMDGDLIMTECTITSSSPAAAIEFHTIKLEA